MRQTSAVLFLLFPVAALLGACGRGEPAPTAAVLATSTVATATVGGATLQASSVAIANLDPAMAARYGFDPGHDGALLLVTLRDGNGDALPPADLQLTATARVLPDPPKPLELQRIEVGNLIDYVGVFPARPPASVQFHVTASRSGARAEMDTTAELYPR
ncbi:DUF4426 domain-containing protein [Thermomonas fusca]|uniref:DUF4426 domain-containing protein n=1 Tax=Thermomonas fusca TaxID=215690 RepID=A0A5R9PI54_9GAMM|nr:DUF4426 domain-containing protein [Thermomonas fusca]TLX23204.1 DUF4426 domain-containing protein [Thermomonas fusca]